MRPNRSLLFITTISLLLSACSVNNFFQTSTKDDQVTSTLHQLIDTSIENTPYTISVHTTENETPTHTITIDTSSIIHIIDLISSDSEEYIYTPDNQVYFNKTDADSWLKLTVGKIHPAKDLLRWNVLSWSDAQLNSSTVELVDDSICDSCLQYRVVADTLSLNITVDDPSKLITSANFNHDNIKYLLTYRYNSTEINIPKTYNEYSIPSDPSESDIETIQEIYGTN